MHVTEVDPKTCTRWAFADRSGFEFGDLFELAEDIKNNGQIEPVILRKSKNPSFLYEVVAGSRRWKACLEAGIKLKGIVQELSDEQASVVQIKENQHLTICDYSKGLYYTKLLEEKKTTKAKLAKLAGYSYSKLDNFLAFSKIPADIWDAIGNPTRVSSRTAATIYFLSQKGNKYVDALIKLADEIRKGIGSRTLERSVIELIKGKEAFSARKAVALPSGQVIARWVKGALQFEKDLAFDPQAVEKALIKYFEKTEVADKAS